MNTLTEHVCPYCGHRFFFPKYSKIVVTPEGTFPTEEAKYIEPSVPVCPKCGLPLCIFC